MGFTYLKCIRCGNNFLHHNFDFHLQVKEMNGVQCQDCHTIETIFTFTKLIYDFTDFESYKQECREVIENGTGEDLIEHGLMVHDGEHGFRYLTEHEFNIRLNGYRKRKRKLS